MVGRLQRVLGQHLPLRTHTTHQSRIKQLSCKFMRGDAGVMYLTHPCEKPVQVCKDLSKDLRFATPMTLRASDGLTLQPMQDSNLDLVGSSSVFSTSARH